MRVAKWMLFGMTLCAMALIGSSWLFKGNLVGELVDAVLYLYLATVSFFASQVLLALSQIFVSQSRKEGS